jgi:hypothetical protein
VNRGHRETGRHPTPCFSIAEVAQAVKEIVVWGIKEKAGKKPTSKKSK